MTRTIRFNLPEDKPNGNNVQDELLKDWQPDLVYFESQYIEVSRPLVTGWVYNKNTGDIDFSEVGGIANGMLTMQCSKL